ncbi:MAG: hypothetical protein ACQEUZ_18445 [Pseudomonadota bacterium]
MPADLDAALRVWLEDAARAGRRPTYGEAVRALAVPGPGAVAKLTDAAERLMAEDVAEGRALRAAVLAGRLRRGLPAPGFFRAARALGRYDGSEDGPEAGSFHAAELARLRIELG